MTAKKHKRRKSAGESSSGDMTRSGKKEVSTPSPPVADAPAEEFGDTEASPSFPVVGVGASAGGLEALTRLLRALPADTGAAFVLVQHLSPSRESELAAILSRATSMPVTEVVDEPEIQPNQVYVLPPGKAIVIARRNLRLLAREVRGVQHPIDQFFRSLAESQRHMAIGVVLSGTATDGTLGLEEIKAEGGITFAQDDTAGQSGMPQSAIASGCVDFVLSPEEIAKEIVRIVAHPQLGLRLEMEGKEQRGTEHAEEEAASVKAELHPVLRQLRKATNVDFTEYKGSTLSRRIRRRMVLAKQKDLEDYERFLRENHKEVQALYQDILINVTGFFRDPETFEALKAKVLPDLLEDRSREQSLRVWVLGCSTGEEAYSLAMILSEVAESVNGTEPAQIFATDLNATSIEHARAGLYSEARLQNVSPERLRRFFVKHNGRFQVAKALREMCVFSRHNVMADPPFSRIDILSCRNLLIYMEPQLQQRILPLLHYALRPGGFLVLGASETVGPLRELFGVEDKKHKIYSKKSGPGGLPRLPVFPLHRARRDVSSGAAAKARAPVPAAAVDRMKAASGSTDAQKEADRLLASFAPPAVLVDANLEIVQFRGNSEPYLAPAEGKASLALLKMARQGLLVPLRTLLHRAKQESAAVSDEGLWVQSREGPLKVNLEVLPVKGHQEEDAFFLVLFKDASSAPERDAKKKRRSRSKPSGASENYEAHITRLEHELGTGREHLQALIEQHDAANEELQSANEEAQSANEELQSINEELATSKEEIQSSNEELTTINDELHNRNVELGLANSDLANLINSVHVAIVIVGRDLRIRRLSPVAEKLLSIIPADVGRPITDIRMKLGSLRLDRLLTETIETLSPMERELQMDSGRWYALRIRPYITIENRVDGAVFSLIDIDASKRARDYAENIVATVSVPLLILDWELRVRSANPAFYATFQVKKEETEGRLIYKLGNGQWDIPELKTLLAGILLEDSAFDDFEVMKEFEGLGLSTMLLNGRAVAEPYGERESILLAIEDITEKRQAEEARARLAAIVTSSEDAIISQDLDGIITSWNKGAEHLFGYSAEEMIGKPGARLIPVDHADEEQRILDTIRRGEGIEHYETVRSRKDGRRLEVSLTISPLKDGVGRTTGASKITRDITDRKRGEIALLEHQQRLELALESANAGEWDLDLLTGQGQCSFRHDQCFGATEPIPDWSYEKFLTYVHPGDRANEDRKFRAAVASGKDWNISCRVLWPDGSVHWIESSGRNYRVDGKPTRMLGLVRDVTERQLLEQKLRDSEVRYRRLFETAYDGVLSLDAGTAKITDANPFIGELLGYARAELLNKELWEIGLFQDAEASKAAMRELKEKGFMRYEELPLKTKTGKQIAVEFVSNVYDEGDHSVIQCNIRDITERRRLEEDLRNRNEQLAEADISKNNFIAMLSHELRSPLNAIRGWIQILRRPGTKEEDLRTGLDVIDRNSKAQAELISDLLDVHRIVAGKLRLELATVYLREVIDSAVDAVSPAAAAKEIHIKREMDPAPAVMSGDSARLQQVLSNLLGNAIKFTPSGGHVRVTLRQKGARAEVVVGDTGRGISAAALPHVFERFRQAGSLTSRYEGGLGLGLAISKQLVELHGGTISVESAGPGNGATFSVSLPLLSGDAAGSPLSAGKAVEEESVSLGGIFVLVVDDEPDAREPLRRELENAGAEVLAVDSTDAAIDALRHRMPDVIVSDIGMPGRDGYDLMRSVRALPATGGGLVPAIALTAYAAPEDRERALAAGYHTHLPKPVEPAKLIAAVAALAPRSGGGGIPGLA